MALLRRRRLPACGACVRAGRCELSRAGRWNVKMDESGSTIVASSYAMVTVSKIRMLGSMYVSFERSHVPTFSLSF